MTMQETVLRWFLRVVGGMALLAVFCVVMPGSWMNAVHRELGMGELPGEPVVGYLARSASGFYAVLGGLFWVVSYDLGRHRLVLCYLGAAILLFGLALVGVDLLEGMPLWWTVSEGVANLVMGIVILALAWPIGRETG